MNMLIIHLAVALTSILVATWALIIPSQKRLQASYLLTIATLASGTMLVIETHAKLLQACTSGLAYLAVVGILLVFARIRLQTKQ